MVSTETGRMSGLTTACLILLAATISGCITTSKGPPIRASIGPVVSGTQPCGPGGACAAVNGVPAGSGMACPPTGCGSAGVVQPCGLQTCEVPRELRKTALPEYRVEPPDVLLIEAVSNLRAPDTPIEAGEQLLIQVDRTIPVDNTASPVTKKFKTIDGIYVVGTDGYVNLGPEYGKVLCAGQPLAEVQRRIEMHLRRILQNPQVLVTLPDPTAKQLVAGPHLVRPDGTVGLGIYGGVFVAGMSLSEAKCAIEQHLSRYMYSPEVSVDVLEYRSKMYYVIADGGGAGERVYRLPSTGNETVLDAVAQVNGLPSVACKGKIWIARPSPECNGPDKILPVDWNAIAQGAQTCTNYQLLPGDRLYVQADPFIRFNTKLAKITAPFERILGLALLGRAVDTIGNN